MSIKIEYFPLFLCGSQSIQRERINTRSTIISKGDMFFEKLKAIEQQADKQSLQFLSQIHIELKDPLSICKALVQALHQYFKTPKTPNLPFQNIITQFNYAAEVPKTKSRLCGGILKKGDRAYKCLECMTEDNSILCPQCFQLEKHRGHQFEVISVFGGCCDCGDPEKWRPQGFCPQHSKVQQISVQLDEALMIRFIQVQHFAFKIVLILYGALLTVKEKMKDVTLLEGVYTADETKKFRISVESKVRVYLEAYCILYLQQLIDFNSNGKFANSMTDRLFKTRLDLTQLPPQALSATKGETNFFKLLFIYLEFNKTPEKVCQLCITLFPLQGFRQVITVQYMAKYSSNPDFPTSSYSHLSSQLFTSYLAISSLARQKKISPLTVHPKLEQQSDLDDAAQAFVRYYYDINYLTKLYGDAGIQYFTFHAEHGKIPDLCDYKRIFNQYPTSKDFYGLEEIFLNRMLGLLQIIERDRSGVIMRKSLRQIYKFITHFPTDPNNLYRPHQRLFALLAIKYLEGDLTRLSEEAVVSEFFEIIGVQHFQEEITIILENICTIFSFAGYLMENQRKIHQNFTFYSFYLKKSVILFNLDAVLMKIIITLCESYNKLNSYQINYSQIIKRGDKFFDIIGKMERYTSHIQQTNLIQNTKDINLTMEQEHIQHFINYLSLINEAVTSDLPLLAVKCFIQPTKQDIRKHKLKEITYEDQAMHYYSYILKSCQNGKVQIKDFKAICDVFFKQEQVFKTFIKSNIDSLDSRRLDSQKSKGQKMSLIYFRSNTLRASGIVHDTSLNLVPYLYRAKTLSFIQNDIISLANKCIEFVFELQKALQVSNMPNPQNVTPTYIKMIFNFVWTVWVQTHNRSIFDFVISCTKRAELAKHLEHLNNDIKDYNKEEDQMQLQPSKEAQQSKEQMAKKEKQKNKKLQMMEKMNKNKNNPLLLSLQKTAQKQEQRQQQFCCLCKQTKQNEDNCFIAILSETNYYPWANLSPQNALYTVTSCGHEVHRSCYQKILKKNQIYSFCPLCKTPMNIVIPKRTKKESEQNMSRFWSEFHKLNRNYNAEACDKEDGAILFLSLVAFSVVKGLLFPEMFKKQMKVYRTLADLVRFYYNQHNQENETFFELGTVKTLALKEKNDYMQELVHLFANEVFNRITNIGYSYKTSRLSHQLVQHSKNIIAAIFSTNSLQIIQPQLQQLNELRQTPNLAAFSNKYLGKCPNCQLATNQQAICLICPSFVTCIKCESVKLMFHARDSHRNSCSFLKTHTGQVVLIYRNRFWQFESVFEDYMGRPYLGTVNKGQFTLNRKKFQTYLEDVVRNGIQSKLRYKEKESNRVNHDQQL